MADRTVLLVEDNADDAELTARAFAREVPSARLLIARDGTQALAQLYGPGGSARSPLPALVVLDVREAQEYQINRIDGSVLIPLGEIPRRYAELDPESELVMQCKVGARSAKAADFLRSVGFKRVLNLQGGILEWIDKVDPSQPKY